MKEKRLVRWLWGLAAALGLILVLKFFVADVYRISSGSMRPTLFGGSARSGDPPFTEWVLMRYDRAPAIERYDLVVVDVNGESVVKRACGLPGEAFRIVDGDLMIDGARLPLDVPRPEPILVFDDGRQAVEDFFYWKDERDGADVWRQDEAVWTLDATDVPLGSYGGTMYYQPEIRDDYFDAGGQRVVGQRTVNDAVLELEFAVDASQGNLRFELVEKGDTFVALVVPDEAPDAQTSHRVLLLRRNPETSGVGEELARAPFPLTRGLFQRLWFANVDNTVWLRLPDSGVELVRSYAENVRHPAARGTPGGTGDQSVGPRVGFGGEGIRARFRGIRILRDQHYTAPARDRQGIDREIVLGPDQVFLLGDNSRISDDSRHFGPVSLGRILGKPVWVVWPAGRVRRLVPSTSW